MSILHGYLNNGSMRFQNVTTDYFGVSPSWGNIPINLPFEFNTENGTLSLDRTNCPFLDVFLNIEGTQLAMGNWGRAVNSSTGVIVDTESYNLDLYLFQLLSAKNYAPTHMQDISFGGENTFNFFPRFNGFCGSIYSTYDDCRHTFRTQKMFPRQGVWYYSTPMVGYIPYYRCFELDNGFREQSISGWDIGMFYSDVSQFPYRNIAPLPQDVCYAMNAFCDCENIEMAVTLPVAGATGWRFDGYTEEAYDRMNVLYDVMDGGWTVGSLEENIHSYQLTLADSMFERCTSLRQVEMKLPLLHSSRNMFRGLWNYGGNLDLRQQKHAYCSVMTPAGMFNGRKPESPLLNVYLDYYAQYHDPHHEPYEDMYTIYGLTEKAKNFMYPAGTPIGASFFDDADPVGVMNTLITDKSYVHETSGGSNTIYIPSMNLKYIFTNGCEDYSDLGYGFGVRHVELPHPES